MIDLEKEREAFESGLEEIYLPKDVAGNYHIQETQYQWEIHLLNLEIEELKARLAESEHEKEYAEKASETWIDRAYKQRAKVELIKNEVEKFKVKGTSSDLERFLDYLIETAKFKHDEEFKDHVLVPKEPTEAMMVNALAVIATGIGKDHIDLEIIKCWEKMLEAAQGDCDD